MPTERELARIVARFYLKMIVANHYEIDGSINIMKKMKRKALAKTKKLKKDSPKSRQRKRSA